MHLNVSESRCLHLHQHTLWMLSIHLSHICGGRGIPPDKQQLHRSGYCDSCVCDLSEFEEAQLSEDRVREGYLLFNAQLMLKVVKYQGETTTGCITSKKCDSL